MFRFPDVVSGGKDTQPGDRKRSVLQFQPAVQEGAREDTESTKKRSLQQFQPAEDTESTKKRSLQQFKSITQENIESDKKRSLQQFQPAEDTESTKKRSLQQFKPITQENTESDKKRSLQQFQLAGTQSVSQSKHRPRSIIEFIPRPSIKETNCKRDSRGSLSVLTSHQGSLSLILESFNHWYTFPLGRWTAIVFETENISNSHVLQICSIEDWDEARSQLVEIARSDSRLVPTHFVFYEGEHENYWIGSEKAGICLADVISCSWQMDENAASVILGEVVRTLHHLRQLGIQYNGVKASNVYLSTVRDRDGKFTSCRVQLANFAPHLKPTHIEMADVGDKDCIDIGWLAINILTRADKPNKSYEASAQTKGHYGPFTIDMKKVTPSQDLIDFLQICAICDINKLVNHKYLRSGDNSCLYPYSIHAGYFAVGPRWQDPIGTL